MDWFESFDWLGRLRKLGEDSMFETTIKQLPDRDRSLVRKLHKSAETPSETRAREMGAIDEEGG